MQSVSKKMSLTLAVLAKRVEAPSGVSSSTGTGKRRADKLGKSERVRGEEHKWWQAAVRNVITLPLKNFNIPLPPLPPPPAFALKGSTSREGQNQGQSLGLTFSLSVNKLRCATEPRITINNELSATASSLDSNVSNSPSITTPQPRKNAALLLQRITRDDRDLLDLRVNLTATAVSPASARRRSTIPVNSVSAPVAGSFDLWRMLISQSRSVDDGMDMFSTCLIGRIAPLSDAVTRHRHKTVQPFRFGMKPPAQQPISTMWDVLAGTITLDTKKSRSDSTKLVSFCTRLFTMQVGGSSVSN